MWHVNARLQLLYLPFGAAVVRWNPTSPPRPLPLRSSQIKTPVSNSSTACLDPSSDVVEARILWPGRWQRRIFLQRWLILPPRELPIWQGAEAPCLLDLADFVADDDVECLVLELQVRLVGGGHRGGKEAQGAGRARRRHRRTGVWHMTSGARLPPYEAGGHRPRLGVGHATIRCTHTRWGIPGPIFGNLGLR
jgi:hypothetical protein